MPKNQTSKIVCLDFDGVLFDTLEEVYFVCQKVAQSESCYRKDVSFEEFKNFRRYLCDAWQFNRLYSLTIALSNFSDLSHQKSVEKDVLYADRFFKMREKCAEEIKIEALAKPTKFFQLVTPWVESSSDRFMVLSTRPSYSIRRVLDAYDWPQIKICGQAEIQKFGNKTKVAEALGYLGSAFDTIFIDDMAQHLDEFVGRNVKTIQANWGYDLPGDKSADEAECIEQVANLLDND